MKRLAALFSTGLVLFIASLAPAYPLDGYPETGIRRLEAGHLAVLGKIRGRRPPPGARLPTRRVDLRLLDHPDLNLPQPDSEFSARLVRLLGSKADRYALAVLDLSDLDHPRYAQHRPGYRQNVGSVGKLAVAVALFQALADVYPADINARRRVLRQTVITADDFIQWDHHKVRIWNPATGTLNFRPLRRGDQGSLWEYLDWTLSISSNAAASMTMKNAMLLRHFRRHFPVSIEKADRFFKKATRRQLRELYVQTFLRPLARNGLDLKSFRQGSFFTRYGKQHVPTGYNSYGTVRELVHLLLLMEQGRLVDAFSSREIKRLLYMTERRIRYASAPILRDSAVYFKSGSLYSCRAEPGFVCKKYHGNLRNYMNSVAIVETPAGIGRLYYLVAVISNVLSKNSAVEHQTLATHIHRIITSYHPVPPSPAGQLPPELTFGSNLIGFSEKQQQRLQVAKAQAALLQLGHRIGKIDGKAGPQTVAAVRRFQKQHHYKVDGKISEKLLQQLKAAVGSLTPAATLQPGRTATQ